MKIYKHSLIAVAILAQGTVGMASQSKDHTVDPETLSEPNHKDLGAPQGKPRTTFNTRQLKAIKDIGASATGYYLRSLRAEKVHVCHKGKGGIYKNITIADAAYAKHVDHGDGKVGDPVPDMPGYAFDDDCDTKCKPSCSMSAPDAGCEMVEMVGCGSCTEDFSCSSASATIGDGSCTAYSSCSFASGTIGDGSCTAPGSCEGCTAGTIGDGSCTAGGSCSGATGTIGHESCNKDFICNGCTADVGDNECNGGLICPCN